MRAESSAPLLPSPSRVRLLGLGCMQHSPRGGGGGGGGSEPDSPRRLSWRILKTCAVIIAVVLCNVAAAAVIIPALHAFSGAGNKAVQPPAAHRLREVGARQQQAFDNARRLGHFIAATVGEADTLYALAPGEGAQWWPAEAGPEPGVLEEVEEVTAALPERDLALPGSPMPALRAGGEALHEADPPAAGAPAQEVSAPTAADSADAAAAAAGTLAAAGRAAAAAAGDATEAVRSLVAQARAVARQSFTQRPVLPAMPAYPAEEDGGDVANPDATGAELEATAAEAVRSADPTEHAPAAPPAAGRKARMQQHQRRQQQTSSAASSVRFITTAALAGEERAAGALPDLAFHGGSAAAAVRGAIAAGLAAEGEGTPALPGAAAMLTQMEGSGAMAAAGAPVSGFWGGGGLAPAPAPMQAPDACAAALGIPKVAMMFLSRGELFHEATWEAWFRSAAGLIPAAYLRRNATCTGSGEACACSSDRLALARQACAELAPGGPALAAQHLFSVYTHPLPEFGQYPAGSLFAGTEIADRVEVSWGAFELVIAARALLRAALGDPLNQKFILLSESGVPLYPAALVYAQLIQEDRSRLDSCGIHDSDMRRYSPRMGEAVRDHWRKSSQWFGLTRKHAVLVTSDTLFLDIFRQHCWSGWDGDVGRERDCYADEHYMASLLAYLQMGDETDCAGFLVNVSWKNGGAHPYAYSLGEISPDLFVGLRGDAWCNQTSAISTYADAFVHVSRLAALARSSRTGAKGGSCSLPPGDYDTRALGYDCPLFARKFPKMTAATIHGLLSSCASGLNITGNGVCTEGPWDRRKGAGHISGEALKVAMRRKLRGPDQTLPWDEGWL